MADSVDMGPRRHAFKSMVPNGGVILDLGCGSGMTRRRSERRVTPPWDSTCHALCSRGLTLAMTFQSSKPICAGFHSLTRLSTVCGRVHPCSTFPLSK